MSSDMQNSRRIKRMGRGRRPKAKIPTMNLVSMMDIFTILVFFLLVNISDTQELPNPKAISLPASIAEQKPSENIIVFVSGKEVLVKNRVVALIADVESNDQPTVADITTALEEEASRVIGTTEKALLANRSVTIMGDKAIPFKILKKVMASCTAAGYEKIALAVVNKNG